MHPIKVLFNGGITEMGKSNVALNQVYYNVNPEYNSKITSHVLYMNLSRFMHMERIPPYTCKLCGCHSIGFISKNSKDRIVIKWAYNRYNGADCVCHAPCDGLHIVGKTVYIFDMIQVNNCTSMVGPCSHVDVDLSKLGIDPTEVMGETTFSNIYSVTYHMCCESQYNYTKLAESLRTFFKVREDYKNIYQTIEKEFTEIIESLE